MRIPGIVLWRRSAQTTAVPDQGIPRLLGHPAWMSVSLHTLRHTFISRLAQAGWPLPEVAALAGHRDIKMTLRYAHWAPSHLRAGIQALEQQRNGGDWVAPGLSTENCVTLVSREMS